MPPDAQRLEAECNNVRTAVVANAVMLSRILHLWLQTGKSDGVKLIKCFNCCLGVLVESDLWVTRKGATSAKLGKA